MATSYGSRNLLLLLLTSGFLIAGLLFDYMPAIVDSQIKRTIELATNDEIRTLWSRPPVDLHSYYWLYDVLNPDQFMAGEKMRLRKVGPFHFTSRIEKKIIELSQNKFRIVYNSTRHMQLNESEPVDGGSGGGGAGSGLSGAGAGPGSPPELLGALLDRPLTLVNPVFASLVEGARVATGRQADPQTAHMMLVSAARLAERFNESLLVRTTARQMLLGRRVPLIGAARKLAEAFGGDGLGMPASFATSDLVGLVSLQNGSWSGPYEVYTGYQASMSSLGDVISYEGKKRLSTYAGKCNRLQASAGELRPMPLAPGQPLEMFMPALCRIIHLKQTGGRKLREGLAYSYQVARENFQSGWENAENRCFCVNSTSNLPPVASQAAPADSKSDSKAADAKPAGQNDFCSLSGAIELGPCLYNSPLVVSMGHVGLDPRIGASLADWEPELSAPHVDALPEPDPKAQMLVLARIGIPVQADVTIVTFLRVMRDPRFRQTSAVPELSFVPLAMVRETASIPGRLARVIVGMESLLALCAHVRLVMYLSAVLLLCWLTGHHYRSTSAVAGQPERPEGAEEGAEAPANGAGPRRELEREQRASRPAPRAPPQQQQQQAPAPSPPPPPAAAPPAAAEAQLQRPEGGAGSGAQAAKANGARPEPQARDKRASRWRAAQSAPAPPQPQPGELAPPADEGQLEGPQRPAGNPSGWLVRVFADFVRLLSNIRTSISDASQLEVARQQDEFQDKQLELLAGKIDNWYAADSSPAGSASGRPASALDAAGEGPAERAPLDPGDGEARRQRPEPGGAAGAPAAAVAATEAPPAAAAAARLASSHSSLATNRGSLPDEPEPRPGNSSAANGGPSRDQSAAPGDEPGAGRPPPGPALAPLQPPPPPPPDQIDESSSGAGKQINGLAPGAPLEAAGRAQ